VFGLLPRLTAPLAFGLVIAAYLLDFVGPLLELPDARSTESTHLVCPGSSSGLPRPAA